MSNPVAQCTHVKTNGEVCGCPAVSGTAFCYHHSAVKTALGKASSRRGRGEFEPIPFVFAEDRASMQINYHLLMQAFNEGRIDLKNFKAMMSMLKAMSANLGKTGSLVEDREGGSGTRDQKSRGQDSGRRAQEDSEEDDVFADLRHLPKPEFYAAVRARGRKMYEEECAAEEQKLAIANAGR